MTDNTPGRRGRPPRNDPEWARDIQRRVEELEGSRSVRIGDWVLNQNRNGDLIASTMSGVTIVLAESPTTAATTRSAMPGRGETSGPQPETPTPIADKV
jgi:hypothetical protein